MKAPPMLLGAALLFWGWETGYFVPSLLLAGLVEASCISARRWELGETDFQRYWDLSVLLNIIAAILAGMSDHTSYVAALQTLNVHSYAAEPEQTTAAYALVQWTPICFLPVVLAQRCAAADRIPVRVFFLLLRDKPPEPGFLSRSINVTYPYLVICLAASGAANQRNPVFYLGLTILVGWALWATRPRRHSFVVFLLLLVIAGKLGYWGHQGLHQLQGVVENGVARLGARFLSGAQNPLEARTGLGRIGELKLSGRIVMRVRHLDGPRPPSLLRTASYDQFTCRSWFASNRAFENVPASTEGTTWYLHRNGAEDNRAEITTRGLRNGALVALPSDATRVERLQAEMLERNVFGAVKVTLGPRFSRHRIVYGNGPHHDSAPTDQDLRIPAMDVEGVSRAATAFGLVPDMAIEDAVANLTVHFANSFRYSTYQSPESSGLQRGVTPITNFLTNTHAGHCEYFGAATAMLLRHIGIPARYAIGYAVQESGDDPDTYIVRQRHAHAWCIYYAGGAWHDLDTTPASWLDVEAEHAGFWEPIADAWSSFRDALSSSFAPGGAGRKALPWVAALLTAFLAYRLLFRKGASDDASSTTTADRASAAQADSPYFLLEERLSQLGFPRPVGEPVGRWLSRVWPHLALPASACGEIVALHYRRRFDPAGASPADDDALAALVRQCLDALKNPRPDAA